MLKIRALSVPVSTLNPNIVLTTSNKLYTTISTSLFPFQSLNQNRIAGRPGSSEVRRNPLTRWDVSSIPANGIFLTKKKTENAQRVEND